MMSARRLAWRFAAPLIAALATLAIGLPGQAQAPIFGGRPAYPGGPGGAPFGGGPFPGAPGLAGQPGFPTGPGIQGGFVSHPLEGILAPGQVAVSYAYCTDLFLDPPDHTARYRPPATAGRLLLPTGLDRSLADAVKAGMIVVRGPRPLEPLPRDRWGALRILWANQSREPVVLQVNAGTLLTPEGQAAVSAPHLPQILAAAERLGMGDSQVTQYAIWAARGATREDVEQTRLVALSPEQVRRVEQLLEAAGAPTQFDRDPGRYEALYEGAAPLLGERTRPFAGRALLDDGTLARVEGRLGAEGAALLTVTPLKHRQGRFLMAARLSQYTNGRWRARLFHLKTGRKLGANHGELIIYPSRSAAES